MTNDQCKILLQIQDERDSQDEKWGEQNHDPLFWIGIIGEEYGEACKAAIEAEEGINDSPGELRHELVQVAASAVAMIEYLDRRESREAANQNKDRG